MLHFSIHDFPRSADALAALFAYGHKLTQLLDRFGLVATHDFTEGFITDGITQADVHCFITRVHFMHSVNANRFYFKPTLSRVIPDVGQKKRAPKCSFFMLQWPFARPQQISQLSDNFSNNTRANGTAAFADCEAQTFVHSDWVDQGNNHFDVVAWHNHFNAFWQLY